MRISDWSSDVCSSDLRHGRRRRTAGSSGVVHQAEGARGLAPHAARTMTDSGEKQSVAGTPQAIGLISGLKGFMVWTGGSLAGITAVLYVCGYLITTAHIYTLGLYGLVDFSKDYFLLEGSKFVLTLVIGIAQAVINTVTILAATVLAPIALAVIFSRGPLART